MADESLTLRIFLRVTGRNAALETIAARARRFIWVHHADALLVRSSLWTWFLALICVAAVGFLTAYPVGLLLIKSFVTSRPGQPITWGLEGWIGAFSDDALSWALLNTFNLAAVRVAITTALAVFFAWVVTRTDTPWKGLLEVSLWLGFFLPLLPMTMGWILLLDPHNGLVNKFLVNVFGLTTSPFNVYSFWGIVWCHLAFSTSIRFLLITPAFRSMDAALEEAAWVSGSGNFGTLCRITVPILAPAIVAGTALGFIKSLESFEIELVLGIPAGIYVVPTKIYDYIRWEPPFYGRATALSAIFLAMIFILIWIQGALLGKRHYTTVTGRGYAARSFPLGRWRWVTFALCLAFIGVMIALPLAVLLMGTFMTVFGFFDLSSPWTTEHWATVFRDPVFFRSLINTVVLGLGAAAVGMLVYAVIAYYIVRSRLFGRKIIDVLSWLPWGLPGVLISLSLLWVILGSGGWLRVLYGTIWVLILGILIKEMPLGTQIIKAGIMQISSELEEASTASGASWTCTFRRILLPLLNPVLIAIGIIVFIVAARDVSTVIFLATHRTRTMSLLMLDYIAEASLERAAVVGVLNVFLIFALLFAARLARLRVNPGGG